MQITIQRFRQFVASSSGVKLLSIGGRSAFEITERGSGFVVTLASGKSRNISGSNVERVLAIFNRTGSVTTTDYHDVTTNGSYLLAILRTIGKAAGGASTGAGDPAPSARAVEEGRRVPSYHLRLERDPGIVRRKKSDVMRALGCLRCECCGFDFTDFYGDLGCGFAECHHRVWLSDTPPETLRLTQTSDLAVVCANCHRMLHRHRGVDVDGLRRIVAGRRKGFGIQGA